LPSTSPRINRGSRRWTQIHPPARCSMLDARSARPPYSTQRRKGAKAHSPPTQIPFNSAVGLAQGRLFDPVAATDAGHCPDRSAAAVSDRIRGSRQRQVQGQVQRRRQIQQQRPRQNQRQVDSMPPVSVAVSPSGGLGGSWGLGAGEGGPSPFSPCSLSPLRRR